MKKNIFPILGIALCVTVTTALALSDSKFDKSVSGKKQPVIAPVFLDEVATSSVEVSKVKEVVKETGFKFVSSASNGGYNNVIVNKFYDYDANVVCYTTSISGSNGGSGISLQCLNK